MARTRSGFKTGAAGAFHPKNGVYSPGACRGLMSRLRTGVESASMVLLGDSTGNESTEWFAQLATWLGTKFPAYTVTHLGWDDIAKGWTRGGGAYSGGSWTVPWQLQVGTAGDAYFTPSATGWIDTPDAAGQHITGDIDVRALIKPSTWGPAAGQAIAAKFGASGNRGWRFTLGGTSRKLGFEASQDGTALPGIGLSTVAVPFNDGDTGWVRATFTASTSTIRFYTSTDGDTWTLLGGTVTLGTITAIYPTTAKFEIGTRGSGSDAMTGGRIYSVGVYSGIGGQVIYMVDFDTAIGSMAQVAGAGNTFTDSLGLVWTQQGSGPVFAGAPGLIVYNGSIPGAVIAAATTGRALYYTTFPPDVAFISYCHNDNGQSYRTAYKALADLLISTWPDVGVVACTQNPKLSPQTNSQIVNHAVRCRQIRQLAMAQRYGLVDVYEAFSADSRGVAALVNASDGIHPTQAGEDLWAAAAEDLFAAWTTVPAY